MDRLSEIFKKVIERQHFIFRPWGYELHNYCIVEPIQPEAGNPNLIQVRFLKHCPNCNKRDKEFGTYLKTSLKPLKDANDIERLLYL